MVKELNRTYFDDDEDEISSFSSGNIWKKIRALTQTYSWYGKICLFSNDDSHYVY